MLYGGWGVVLFALHTLLYIYRVLCVCVCRGALRYTLDGYLEELQGGVTYISTVKDMLDQAENDWPTMLARLERVRATLLSKEQFLVNLTGDQVC